MIDRLNRDTAAKLIRKFRDGQISSDDLEFDWPASQDRSLSAIASMVWCFYDDHRPRRMIGRSSATAEESEALTRYATFLETDLPYAWPQTNFYRVAGVGVVLLVISFGLLWPLDRWIKRRNARFDAEMKASGDIDVWPFTRRSEYDGSGQM